LAANNSFLTQSAHFSMFAKLARWEKAYWQLKALPNCAAASATVTGVADNQE
jgi:hypothetical protein